MTTGPWSFERQRVAGFRHRDASIRVLALPLVEAEREVNLCEPLVERLLAA